MKSTYLTPRLIEEGVEDGVPYRIVETWSGEQLRFVDYELARKREEARVRESLQAAHQSSGRLSRAYHKPSTWGVARRERGYANGKAARRS